MVLRRTHNLLSSQSLPHDLARLYGRTGPFTSADLVSIEGPSLVEIQIWADSHGPKSFSATRLRRRKAGLQRNQLPDVEETFYVPGPFALIVLMLFTWIVAMWASYGDDSEKHHEVEKPEQSSDEQNHQGAVLKQGVDRPAASPRLQQNRSCVVCEKTCRHTYVFRRPDGGSYGL